MANVLDYINWRGDLTFKQSPFNPVDNLILSCLSYVVMDGMVGGFNSANGVSVKELAIHFEQLSKDEKICGIPRMRRCCYPGAKQTVWTFAAILLRTADRSSGRKTICCSYHCPGKGCALYILPGNRFFHKPVGKRTLT